MEKNLNRKKLHPAQTLVLSFLIAILLGAVFLKLPLAVNGETPSFIDAIFTSTSAVTTTGLIVVDTGSYYSVFGQLLILVLFQIGALGYMTVVVVGLYFIGKKPSLKSGMTLQESFAGLSLGDVKKFLFSVVAYTLFIESISTLLLALYWSKQMPLGQSLYHAFFHAVSAFCTAGFSLYSDSFSKFRYDPVVNIIIIFTCLAGGLGFFVLDELRKVLCALREGKFNFRFSLHTKTVLLASLGLVFTATFAIYAISENLQGLSFDKRIQAVFFQVISASTTTGFNSLDIASIGKAPLFIMLLLMFIGAAPAGSGGGIKSTTLAVLVSYVQSLLRGRGDVFILKRKIPDNIVRKACLIFFLAFLFVLLFTMALCITEEAQFFDILFEVVSALGTVGLSTGITEGLSAWGKLILSLAMLAGRLGPVLIVLSLLPESNEAVYSYAEEDVYVG